MATTIISFRWLDLLEKEFDKNFVDLDLIIGEVEEAEELDWIHVAKAKLEALSSCFAQLTHKAQTIFQTNAKLEAELVNLRHELTQSQATCGVLKGESHEMLMRLHTAHLELYRGKTSEAVDTQNVEQIRKRLERDLEEERTLRIRNEAPRQELSLLHAENEMLRKQLLALQSELCRAKLASKYLDKELAGRIQQLQLLSHGSLKEDQHDKLWQQLEAEIHLHRHKTVVKAFRQQSLSNQNENNSGTEFGPKTRKTQPPFHRYITVDCPPHLEFGLSITGGRDYGIPIMVSYIHPDTPAKTCGQFYVGDAILSVNGHSLKEMSHAEAVRILSSQKERMNLEVLYVPAEDDEEEEDQPLSFEQFNLKYKMFDEDQASLASSSAFLQNGRLSRASIDSIRGSTDDILASPRKYPEGNLEFPSDANGIPEADFGPLGEEGCTLLFRGDLDEGSFNPFGDQVCEGPLFEEEKAEGSGQASPKEATDSSLSSPSSNEAKEEDPPPPPKEETSEGTTRLGEESVTSEGEGTSPPQNPGSGGGDPLESPSHATPLEEGEREELEKEKAELAKDDQTTLEQSQVVKELFNGEY